MAARDFISDHVPPYAPESVTEVEGLKVVFPAIGRLDNAARVHECRSWSHLFEPILNGVKTHDLRIDDRNYRVGDLIHLREYDITAGDYTGREAMVQITYITGRGEGQHPCAFSSAVLHRDYVILSIKLVEVRDAG